MAARIAGVCIGFPLLLGYLWFFKYHGIIETVYFGSSILAVWGVPAIPRRFFSLTYIKYLVLLVCVTAIIATLPMIYKDISLINGADVPAATIRLFVVLVELTFILETLKRSNSTRQTD